MIARIKDKTLVEWEDHFDSLERRRLERRKISYRLFPSLAALLFLTLGITFEIVIARTSSMVKADVGALVICCTLFFMSGLTTAFSLTSK